MIWVRSISAVSLLKKNPNLLLNIPSAHTNIILTIFRFIDSLKELDRKNQRTVYRLTLVKGWNADEIER